MSAVQLAIERSLPEDFARLAAETVFVRGSARYRRADLSAQMARFAEPCYVVAREGGELLGGCVLDRRRLRVDRQAHDGVYRALLSVRAGREGQGIGRRIVAAGLAEADRLAVRSGAPVLSYGCVDSHNVAPLALLRAHGARSIASLVPQLSYRQWPRRRVALERIDAQSGDAVQQLVQRTEGDCSVIDETPATTAGWCCRDAQGPMIVANAMVSTLSFDTLGRWNDALVGALVSPFGFARRRFDSRAFRYVRLTRIGVRPGAERGFAAFLDSLLDAHGCHYALSVIDPGRDLAQRLRLHRRPGSLRLMARWHGEIADDFPPTSGPSGLHPVDV